MKKKTWLFQLIYYVSIPLFYTLLLYFASLMMRPDGSPSLGAIVTVTLFFCFLATPLFIAIWMRFSLLKWYVDPFAATCIPLYLYCGMILNLSKRTNDLLSAFKEVNFSLSNNGGEGWVFLGGLFLFGLAASFSVARKNGESISYRLLAKIAKDGT